MHPYQVIIKPVITEKTTRLHEEGKYVFEVALSANKAMVKEAVERAFGVKVLRVNTIRLPGKAKRYRLRITHTSPRKKAVVTLQPGDKIPIFEGT
ncbi:MAG: 50S ribosomal protein L23 [Dehalococcoidia bacterium]